MSHQKGARFRVGSTAGLSSLIVICWDKFGFGGVVCLGTFSFLYKECHFHSKNEFMWLIYQSPCVGSS
jgi:hypothetical protein